MLRLIIADAEFQTVPENMARDWAIRNIAKKNHKKSQEMLLDSNYMHTTIEKYFPGESNRRGRPDIVYIFLEMAMESILNKNKMLDVYIHTRDNYIIHINRETNLPRSYNRFQGLMEDLFKKRSIEYNGTELLSMKEEKIIPFLKNLDGKTIALSPLWICGMLTSPIITGSILLQYTDIRLIENVVWYKPNAIPNYTRKYFTTSTENLTWWAKTGISGGYKWTFNYQDSKNKLYDKLNPEGRQMRNVWSIPLTKQSEKKFGRHPNQKPIELLKNVILTTTKRGDVILDSFGGSGTTAVAALMYGRRCMVIENNPEYYDIILRRVKNEEILFNRI
jgi:rRNA small subunit pseudouridine methyltransferase Nep1